MRDDYRLENRERLDPITDIFLFVDLPFLSFVVISRGRMREREKEREQYSLLFSQLIVEVNWYTDMLLLTN